MKTRAKPPVTVFSVHIHMLPSGSVVQGVGTDGDGDTCVFRAHLSGTDAMDRTVRNLISQATWEGELLIEHDQDL